MNGSLKAAFLNNLMIFCFVFNIILLLFPFKLINLERVEIRNKLLFDIKRNGCKDENITVGRSYYEENIDIKICIFQRFNVLESALGGGCILLYENQGQIDQCTFYYCQVSSQGGAIKSVFCNITLTKICANMCWGGEGGQFASFYQGSLRINYTTISMCEHDGGKDYSLDISSVSYCPSFSNNNISQNAVSVTVLEFCSSIITCIKNNNICDNFISVSIGCDINYGSATFQSANFVNNSTPNTAILYLANGGTGSIFDCVFQNNHGRLFYNNGGIVIINRCFIDHIGNIFYGSPLEFENNTYSVLSTYKIIHYYADICPTGIHDPDPTIEMTPAISKTFDQTQKATPEESPIITQTIYQTLKETDERTLIETPKETDEKTLIETPKETPYMTKTVDLTPIKTNINSPCASPLLSQTFMNTPFSTIEITPTIISKPISTPMETSSDSEAIWENSTNILIGSIAFITILFVAVFMFKYFHMDSFDDKSNHSQSDENGAV